MMDGTWGGYMDSEEGNLGRHRVTRMNIRRASDRTGVLGESDEAKQLSLLDSTMLNG